MINIHIIYEDFSYGTLHSMRCAPFCSFLYLPSIFWCTGWWWNIVWPSRNRGMSPTHAMLGGPKPTSVDAGRSSDDCVVHVPPKPPKMTVETSCVTKELCVAKPPRPRIKIVTLIPEKKGSGVRCRVSRGLWAWFCDIRQFIDVLVHKYFVNCILIILLFCNANIHKIYVYAYLQKMIYRSYSAMGASCCTSKTSNNEIAFSWRW